MAGRAEQGRSGRLVVAGLYAAALAACTIEVLRTAGEREALSRASLIVLLLFPGAAVSGWWRRAAIFLAGIAFLVYGLYYSRWLGPLAAAANALATIAVCWALLPAYFIRRPLHAAAWGVAAALLLVFAAGPVTTSWSNDVTLALSTTQMLYGGAAVACFGAVAIAAAQRIASERKLFGIVTGAFSVPAAMLGWTGGRMLGSVGWWAGIGAASIILCVTLLFLTRDTVRNEKADAHSAG